MDLAWQHTSDRGGTTIVTTPPIDGGVTATVTLGLWRSFETPVRPK
jgi:hypothetical protein